MFCRTLLLPAVQTRRSRSVSVDDVLQVSGMGQIARVRWAGLLQTTFGVALKAGLASGAQVLDLAFETQQALVSILEVALAR